MAAIAVWNHPTVVPVVPLTSTLHDYGVEIYVEADEENGLVPGRRRPLPADLISGGDPPRGYVGAVS